MEHLGPVDEVEDLLDEIVEENGLTEAEAEVPDLGGEGGEAGEVSELGAVTEVEEEVGEVGAPGGQLVEDIHGDQVTGQLQVPQVDAKPVPDEAHQEVNTGNVDPRDLRSDGDKAPEPGVLAESSPLLTDPGAGVDEGAVREVAQDEEENLVWTSLNVTHRVLQPHGELQPH